MKLRAVCLVVGLLSLALSLVQPSVAQTTAAAASTLPRLVRFGGTVKDLNGTALTGVVGVTFALYSEQTGGAALWLETQNVTADGNGHYAALLGSTKPDGLPTELFITAQARWVGVQVSGQAEQPRVLLVSAPYALKAGDAETIGGLPPSAFVLAEPHYGAGAPSHAESAARSATRQGVSSASSTDVTTSGGTVSYLPLWDATSDITSSVVFQSGTGSTAKIGIGTITPASTLDVNGNSTFNGSAAIVLDTRVDFNGLNKGSYTPAIRFGTGNTGEAIASDRRGSININGIDLYTDFTPRLSVTNGGSVGIGTQTPAFTLDVNGAGNFLSTSSANSGLVATGSNGDSTNINGTNGVVGNGGAPQAQLAVGGTGVVGNGGAAENFSGAGVVGTGGSGGPPDGGGGDGGDFYAGSGFGVGGVGLTATGANGTSLSNGTAGIVATGGGGGPLGNGGAGIYGNGGPGAGFPGFPGGVGVYAEGGGNNGAPGTDGDGIFATNPDGGTASTGGYAGYFLGDINVTGKIYAGTKDFRIDHPIDPANKYLLHASVESSEMMNIYSGNATLDGSGEAVVQLPAWFQAVNGDFRYQLTSIGAPGPGLYIAQKVSGNRFKIAGGSAGNEVSWQVTAVRHDAYAKANPLIVEEAKGARERGYYIHPELYGAPKERGIAWARHPQMPLVKRKAPAPSFKIQQSKLQQTKTLSK